MKLSKSIIIGVTIFLIGISVSLLMRYSSQKIMSSYETNLPYVSLGDNVKNKTTTAHLWFEEYMSGDESIVMEKDILPHLESSLELINSAIEGGETELGVFQVCENNELKKQLKESYKSIQDFIAISKQRDKSRKTSFAAILHSENDSTVFMENEGATGGELDQQFDAVYEGIQDNMNTIIEIIDAKIADEQNGLQKFVIILLIATILVFSVMAYFMFKIQNRTQTLIKNDQEKLTIETARLENMGQFVSLIAKGDFSSNLNTGIENDELAEALNHMKETLKQTSESDKRRNWATNGIAEIGDILRTNYTDLNQLYDNIVRFTVKYLNANQGSLFLVNDDHESDKFLELCACYAYDKKKFMEKRIEFGEGLVGQCFLEKDIIFLTDVPNMYTTITSGLGEATPGCIIIVPLQVNEEINGVLEIALFRALEQHEIEFLQRLAESVSSVITSVRVTERTTRLLEQTQQQREEMRAQEEEMRQNLEELQATQEEFARKEQSYIDEIARLTNLTKQ